ncbi:MAG: NAD-dependent epimerase/dehydratase family protein [Candidatus Kariarchaeaceae archaeon]|jgi:nucleoside-diphosphate-sugar epimerase
MKAIVTGATGLVGRHVTLQLLSESWNNQFESVLALGRNQLKLQELTEFGAITEILDLTSNYEEFALLDNWGDAVWFHCAAALSGSKSETLHEVNSTGTKKLIKKAEELSVKRFIHVSSVTVYGLSGGNFLEDQPKNPQSSYGKSKLESETIVMNSTLDWTIFRPSFIGGPYDQNFLLEFTNRINAHKMPFLSREGTIAYIDARDLASCMVQSCVVDKTKRQIYNIQNDKIGYRKFVHLLGDSLKAEKPYGKNYPYYLVLFIGLLNEIFSKIRGKSAERGITRYRIKSLSSNRTMNIDKVKEDLSFNPEYSLEKSIMDWIDHHGSNN